VTATFLPFRTLQTRGPGLFLVHAADLLAVAALLWLCAAIGKSALDRLQIPFATSGERLPFAIALGAGVLAAELLAGCALFGVRPWVIGITLLLTAILTSRHLTAGIEATVRGPRRSAQGSDRLSALAIAGLSAAAAILLLVALAPPSDWDSLMYHIFVPLRWLRDGRISTLAGNEQIAYLGLVHFLYLPLLTIGSLSGPALLNAGLALALGFEAFSLARRLFGPTAAGYTAVLLWGTPTILLVACTARVDVTLSLFLLLAHDALLAAWRGRSRRHLDLAAALLGLAVGVKYSSAVYALALTPLLLAAVAACQAAPGPRLRLVLRFAALSACACAPWLLKNQVLYGAPFYPFLARHRLEPWLTALVPPGVTNLTLDPRVFQIQQAGRASFNLPDAFLHPGNLGVGGESVFYFLNPLLLILPLCLFALRSPSVLGLAGPSLLYLIALVLMSPRGNLRYHIPGIVPLTILCTAMLVATTDRLPRLPRRALRAVLTLGCLVPSTAVMYLWISGNHIPSHALGLTSGDQYLASHVSPVVRSHARMSTEVNRLLAPTDTVLMIFEARGLYLNAAVIEDTRVINWPSLAAALGPSHCLPGTGITHVLARAGAARYLEQRGVPDSVIGRGSFERFAARCLTPVYEDSGATLYSVRAPR
jgi:dolichyl-phosphate-mannose-protein mannosyltransferase